MSISSVHAGLCDKKDIKRKGRYAGLLSKKIVAAPVKKRREVII
jgi:hypothetical protein